MSTIQMCVILALMICLIMPTEAYFYEGEDTCKFKKKGVTVSIKNTIQNLKEDLSCQEVCAENEGCLMWQEEDVTCTLTVVQTKTNKRKISYGISNCGQLSGDTASCGENIDMAAIMEIVTVPGKKDETECEEECQNNKMCLLWVSTVKNKKCVLHQYREIFKADSTFGIKYCTTTNDLPSECTNYEVLDHASRSITNGNGTSASVEGTRYCDHEGANNNESPDWKGAGWYRITGKAGSHIPESNPGQYHCGTVFTGWLNGKHPTSRGETVKDVVICFGAYKRDCFKTATPDTVNITHCGGYFVYELKKIERCPFRYCATN